MADFTIRSWMNFCEQMKVAVMIFILNHFPQAPPPPPPPPPAATSLSRHTLLAFIGPVVVGLLQLKYQGKDNSPFENHSKSIFVSLVSLLLYCWAYDAQLGWPILASVASLVMRVFGSLFWVSLASILFSNSFGPVLYSLYFLFLAAELLKLFIWVYQKIVDIFSSQLATPAVPITGDDLV